jgi:hypothetical protein
MIHFNTTHPPTSWSSFWLFQHMYNIYSSHTIVPSTMQLIFSISLSQRVLTIYGYHQVFLCQNCLTV